MKKNIFIIIIAVILLVLLVVIFGRYTFNLKSKNTSVICTQDVMQCSDGSYVERTGPNCQFKLCPEISTTPNASTNPNTLNNSQGSDVLPSTKIKNKVNNSLSELQARLIAEKSCINGGQALSKGIYNSTSKTWKYDANFNTFRAGCSPFCVVSEVTKNVDVNWVCEEIKKEPVACTMEAKLCPDGSYVGRTPPSCEFTPCP